MKLDDVHLIDDIDHCTVFYNYAMILYRLQQHQKAIEVLSKVFQFVEPLGKWSQTRNSYGNRLNNVMLFANVGGFRRLVFSFQNRSLFRVRTFHCFVALCTVFNH